MIATMSDIPILTFEISCDLARVYCSPLLLKIYAHQNHMGMQTVREAEESLRSHFGAYGKDPMYLDIGAIIENKASLILTVLRFINGD